MTDGDAFSLSPACAWGNPGNSMKLYHHFVHLLVMACCASLPALAMGCGADNVMQVRGQVVEVAPRSFSEIDTLRIRDGEGREFVFETRGFVGFTPSHVKEHQFLGQSLLVTYEDREGVLVAVKLED